MIGQTISHYKILAKLGEGGMGVVYKAEDTRLHRTIALKFLRPDALESRELKARFLTEAEAAAALTHPNICVVHEIDEADEQFFIAMEYVEGENLAQKIRRRPLPLEEALNIVAQVAEGLHGAHGKGIVHRDIKPANVMIDSQARVKIMDFGLAHLEDATRITKSGTALGTPAYMSPEQVRGEKADYRTDIWSLGVVLYEMLSGRLPFNGEVREAVSHSILYERPESLTALRAGVPLGLDRIVVKALAKDPAERYQHADEMLVDLRALRKTTESGSRLVAKPRRKRTVVYATALAVLLLAAAGLFLSQEDWSRPPAREPSIAVLPFTNLSGDPENEYFSDGLAEGILDALTKIPDLRVTARTSSFAFRGKEEDVREIGQQLSVSHVLEGSVQRSAARVRVTAQLISTADGYHLWSDRYDRSMADTFAIQDEIARAIVRELQVRLGPEGELVSHGTENSEAHDLYLRGHHLMYSRIALEQARGYFERAIAIDPKYAQPHYSLGLYYWVTAFWGLGPPRELMPRAKERINTALELDEGLAEAHAVLGIILGAYDYNWEAAEEEFRRALELAPSSAVVQGMYGFFYLFPVSRLDEAAAAVRTALAADPLSLIDHDRLAVVYNSRGQHDEAVEVLQKALAIDPEHFYAYFLLAATYALKGESEEAVAAAEESVRLSGRAPGPLAFLGWTLGTVGRTREASEVLLELKEKARTGYVGAANLAVVCAGLRDIDCAVRWLKRAIADRDPPAVLLGADVVYTAVREDPRYHELLQEMNLKQ